MTDSTQVVDLSDTELILFSENVRLETFKTWPNDPDWDCTPEKLAKAGFYFKPCLDAPDNACCSFCLKELDGWEPEDDPRKEHQKHSPKCPFLSLRKPFKDLTISETASFLMNISKLKAEKMFDKLGKDFVATKQEARKVLIEHNNGSLM